MKTLVKRLLHRTGYTLSANPTLGDFLRSRNVPLVLDIGANTGQFASYLRSEGYSGEIISFEPVPTVYRQLTEVMSHDKGWSGRNVALGDSRGRANINVSQNTVFSSLMPQLDYATEFDPTARVVRSEAIEIEKLDDFMDELGTPQHDIFCKIDTQGHEEAVLRGAARSLPRFCGLQLELPIEHLYRGTWSLSQAITDLDDLGFVPAQMRPTSFLRDDRVSWTEIDCIFRRKTTASSSGLP
jgi:FkbM family methyltransferase